MSRELSPHNCSQGGAHYWLLDDKKVGFCMKCGLKKEFDAQGQSWQRKQIVVIHGNKVEPAGYILGFGTEGVPG